MTWEPRFDPHTHAHTHDPDTSHNAAAKAQGLAARHKAIILNQLHLTNTRYGHGLTSTMAKAMNRTMRMSATFFLFGVLQGVLQTPKWRLQ